MLEHDLQLGELITWGDIVYEVFSLFMCTDGPFLARLRRLDTMQITQGVVLVGTLVGNKKGYTRKKQSIELFGDEFAGC